MKPKITRRSFVANTVSLASLASLSSLGPLTSLLSNQNVAKNLEPLNIEAFYRELAQMGLKSAQVYSFRPFDSSHSIKLFSINPTYGRLANFTLGQTTHATIVSKGPSGLRFAQNNPDLQIVGQFHSDLRKEFYVTDAAPHYWNSLYRNEPNPFKTYFIDDLTRKPVNLYLSMPETELLTTELNEKLIPLVSRFQKFYDAQFQRSLAILGQKYEVAPISALLSSLRSPKALA